MAHRHPGRLDLPLTDVVLPEMNGRELYEAIAAEWPGTKALFMSGYTADAIAQRGVIDEGLQFLQKPFSIRTMSAAVRAALDRT